MKMVVGGFIGMPSSEESSQSQIASQVALARAIYLASIVERATVGCFQEDQEIGAEPKYEM